MHNLLEIHILKIPAQPSTGVPVFLELLHPAAAGCDVYGVKYNYFI